MRKIITIILSLYAFTSCATFKKVQYDPDLLNDNTSGNYLAVKYSEKSGLNYIITFPKEYEPSDQRNFPLVIFLHSMAERGSDLKLLINNQKGQGSSIIPIVLNRNDIISISVLCPDNTYWSFITDRLNKLVLEAFKEYRINRSMVLLTGVSMGGMGVWSFAMDYPELFTAIAPISAGVYSPPMRVNTLNLKKIRIWAFHDRYDKEIPLEKETWFIERLKKDDIMLKYTITEYGRHYIHEDIYRSGELFTWFLND